MSKKKGPEVIVTSGKRKRAIVSARLMKGSGKVIINNVPLELFSAGMYNLRIREPLILAGDKASKVDIAVSSRGGGMASQADAIRLAIAKALAQFDDSLESVFHEYDRTLLVADVRRKEPSKPNNCGSARSRRQKSYR